MHRDIQRVVGFSLIAGGVLFGPTTFALAAGAPAAVDVEALEEEAAGRVSGSSQADSGTTTQQAEPPATSGAARQLSKLQVHGFLTQAYAEAEFFGDRLPNPDGSPAGPNPEELSLGIPEEGTFEYRNLAIQFRYELSDKDIMIVQLSSRALGNSPIADAEEEIELDWAFYERRIGENTAFKIGRVQIPFGIFNEIRDVGTLLPFYRPAFGFYREASFTTETVDGFLISHTFAARSDWSLDADFYFGDWDAFELDPFSLRAEKARNEDSYGGQLWLNTPVSGLRVGAGYQRRNTTEGTEGVTRLPGAVTEFDDYYASFDGAFDRFVVRAEIREFKQAHPETFPVFGVNDFEFKAPLYYIQAGFHATEKFRIYVQYEVVDVAVNSALFTEEATQNQRTDTGIALNYFISPNVVIKAEYHDVAGEDLGFAPVFGPAGFQLQPFNVDLDNGSYTIISLSASF